MAEATPQMPAYLQKQAEQYGLLIWKKRKMGVIHANIKNTSDMLVAFEYYYGSYLCDWIILLLRIAIFIGEQ